MFHTAIDWSQKVPITVVIQSVGHLEVAFPLFGVIGHPAQREDVDVDAMMYVPQLIHIFFEHRVIKSHFREIHQKLRVAFVGLYEKLI